MPEVAQSNYVETTPDKSRVYPMSGNYHDRIVRLVMDRWTGAYNHYSGRFEKFYRYERLIDMIGKRKQFDWRANAFLPYAFAMSELSAAMKWLALFQTRPYVTVKSRVGPQVAEIASRRQALLDWHLSPGGDIRSVFTTQKMFRQSERYGKSIALCLPDWDEGELRYREEEGAPTATGAMTRMIWKTRPTREYKINLLTQDLTDTIIEPGFFQINGPEGCSWIIRRYSTTMEKLRAMEAANLLGPNVGGVSVEEITNSNEPHSNEYRSRREYLQKNDDHTAYTDKYVQDVEILEAQMVVPHEAIDQEKASLEEQFGRDPKRRVCIVANGHWCIGDFALPWDHGNWSYIEMDCVPEVYDFYGRGKVQPIEHLSYAANELLNLRLDNVKQLVHALIGVDGKRMPPGWKRRLMQQPFGVLETWGPPNEVVSRLQMGDVTPSSYQEQGHLYGLMQESTAVNETMLGDSGGKVRTLGEHRLKAELGSTRLQMELVGQAHQLLGYPYGLSGFIIAYDRQYLPFSTYISVVNPEFPDDFLEMPMDSSVFDIEDHHFEYMPTGAVEGMNLASKRRDLAQMLAIMNPWMPAIAGMYGQGFIDEMMKVVLKTFGCDPTRFIQRGQQPGVEGIPQLDQTQLAQLFSQGGPGGGSPESASMPYEGGPGLNNASMVSSALGNPRGQPQ